VEPRDSDGTSVYSPGVILYAIALVGGLLVLVKSADWFVDGAANLARTLGMSPLLIGMLIVGFGTSAPEMLISGISAFDGASGIALGNAWGSNIANIALILGVSALVQPVRVQTRVLRVELPTLTVITAIAALQILDGTIGRIDATILLVLIVSIIGWSIHESRRNRADPIIPAAVDDRGDDAPEPDSLPRSLTKLIGGLVLLVASSRTLVWGAVGIATQAGVSDLVIGLTIIALGTSLPELASSIAAARRGEDDIALGNVLGSNLFNTLAVVGIGAMIRPITVEPDVVVRDLPVVAGLTLLLFVFGVGRRGRPGLISRPDAILLLGIYFGYMGWIGYSLLG
jgi:cation:H+ antiporter